MANRSKQGLRVASGWFSLWHMDEILGPSSSHLFIQDEVCDCWTFWMDLDFWYWDLDRWDLAKPPLMHVSYFLYKFIRHAASPQKIIRHVYYLWSINLDNAWGCWTRAGAAKNQMQAPNNRARQVKSNSDEVHKISIKELQIIDDKHCREQRYDMINCTNLRSDDIM